MMLNKEILQQLQAPDEDDRLQAVMNLAVPIASEDLTELVSVLADKSWRVRKAAVRVLAQTDVALVVPLLIQALSVGKLGIQNVRFHNSAIECLTLIGKPAIPALTIALQDQEKNVRIAAANVLGAIRDHDACDALINALQDPEVNVRYAAVEALSHIPNQKSVLPLTRILEVDEEWLQLPAISALGYIGDYRATPYLINMADNPIYLQTAVEAIGHIGDERGIPCIIKAFSSTDREIRKSAVVAMEHMAHKLDKFHAIIQYPTTYRETFRAACTEQILHHLIDLVEEKDYQLALSAVKLLGWSGKQDAAYALLEKLGYEQLADAVLSALIQIGEEAILPLASAYESSRSLEQQLLLVGCLQEIGGERAFQLLLTYLDRAPEELLTYAILKAFTREPFTSLILQDRHTPAHTYYDHVFRQTQAQLVSTHPLIRAEAIYLWGQLLGTAVLADLLNATKDIDPTIRVKAIEHLGQFVIALPDLIEPLTVLLSDDHPSIRKHAALALGNAIAPAAFAPLLLVLDDSNPGVRRAAVTALGVFLHEHPSQEYQEQILTCLTDVLENRCRRYEDGLLKIEICQTLQQIQTAQSESLLVKLAYDVDFDVRKTAILALGVFRHDAPTLTPLLVTFLKDTHWSVREAAVTALGLLEASMIEADLLAMLDDPDLTVRRALLLTLGRLWSDRVIPILIAYLAHDELDYAAYQGLNFVAYRAKDRIAEHARVVENPKVALFLQHIIEKNFLE